MRDTDTAAKMPTADMNQRNWLTARWIVGIAYGIIVLVVIPMLLAKGASLEWLPLLMALGPFLAGCWVFSTFRREARSLTGFEQASYRSTGLAWLLICTVTAIIVGIGAFIAILIGSTSWFSYTVLKSGGYITYVLLGLLPVICYIWMTQRLLAMRPFVPTILIGLGSLLAPWFWAGFMVYSQYHVL